MFKDIESTDSQENSSQESPSHPTEGGPEMGADTVGNVVPIHTPGPAKRSRGRPRKSDDREGMGEGSDGSGGGSGGSGGHAGPASKKRPNVLTPQLAHRIAAALAWKAPNVSVAVEPLPKPEIKFALLADDEGESTPIRIAPNGEIRPFKMKGINDAVASMLHDERVVDILNDETKGYGALIKEFPSKYLDETVRLWVAYAEKITQDKIKSVKEKSAPGLAWKVLDYDFAERIYDDTPWFDEFLGRCGGKENADNIMAWVGSLFFDESKRSQYLYLYGNGRNSKGSFISAIQYGLGETVAIEGAEFNPAKHEDRFWTFNNLFRKRLVSFKELGNPSFVTSAQFKHFTGDNSTQMQIKGGSAFVGRLHCKFIIGSNTTPNIGGDTADMRRAIYIKPETYNGVNLSDSELDAVFARETPGFFAKCVEKYMVVCPDHKEIKVATDNLDELVESNEDSMATLLERNFIIQPGIGVSVSDLKRLLKENDMPNGKNFADKFMRFVARQTNGTVSDQMKIMMTTSGQARRIYWGLALKRGVFRDKNFPPFVQAVFKTDEKRLLEMCGFMLGNKVDSNHAEF